MAADPEPELLTVSEAARLLKVSVVTLQRWLKQGRLRAYRVGPRYLRIRREDLDKLLIPRLVEGETAGAEEMPVEAGIRPLSEEEVRERLEAIRQAQALIERIRQRRGGEPLAPSWPIIRRAREERSRER